MKRLFTTDVRGQMNPRRTYTAGKYEVIPADSRRERHAAALAQFASACAAAALENRRTRDSRSAPVHAYDPVSRLDRAIAELERAIPDAPNAGPTARQMFEQYSRRYAAAQARRCAASEAAYAARNPHRKEGQ